MSGSFKAILRGVRVSPRKVRLVVDAVRGKNASEALDILRVMNKRSAPVLRKLIESAIANAKNKATVDVDRLIVAEAFVNQGLTQKRWLPRAQGRATPILRRSSQIIVKLAEK
jgi:large subunit ribosomal protein L22